MSNLVLSTAGILLVVLPTVAYGGVSILRLVYLKRSDYMKNELRQKFWRAGHAHAGVFLILSLAALPYLDAAQLSTGLKSLVTWLVPGAAILIPAAFFLFRRRARRAKAQRAYQPRLCGVCFPRGRARSAWRRLIFGALDSAPRSPPLAQNERPNLLQESGSGVKTG